MGWLLWIIFGGIAGWIASIIMKTDARQGMIMNIIVGIIGAFIGGLVMSALGFGGINGFDIYSLLVAILGSVILLWIVKTIS